jgi:hypothetical protein
MPSIIDPTTRDAAPVLNENQARQGVTGHNVRYVLFFGTLGAMVAVGAIYLAFFA